MLAERVAAEVAQQWRARLIHEQRSARYSLYVNNAGDCVTLAKHQPTLFTGAEVEADTITYEQCQIQTTYHKKLAYTTRKYLFVDT